jgi:hypothetical protein
VRMDDAKFSGLSQDRKDEYSAAVPLRARWNRGEGAEFIALLNRIT